MCAVLSIGEKVIPTARTAAIVHAGYGVVSHRVAGLSLSDDIGPAKQRLGKFSAGALLAHFCEDVAALGPPRGTNHSPGCAIRKVRPQSQGLNDGTSLLEIDASSGSDPGPGAYEPVFVGPLIEHVVDLSIDFNRVVVAERQIMTDHDIPLHRPGETEEA